MIIYVRKTVSIAEYWFDEEIQNPAVDVIRIMQRSSPLGNKKYQEFYTPLIDLKQDKDVIFRAMERGTRQFIRRAAEEDGVIYDCCPTDDETIEQFVEYYNKFAKIKGIPQITSRRLKEYASAGGLAISKVLAEDGRILTWIVYYKDPGRVRALLSCSNYGEIDDIAYRQLVGRANRYLHWQDMLKFKEQQVSIYDLGGWYPGDKDLAKLDINKFKKSFGGVIVKDFNQEFGITLKGKLYVFLNSIHDYFIEAIETSKGMGKR